MNIPIVNLDDVDLNDETYGGMAGAKLGITIRGQNYVLKFPNNLKDEKDRFGMSYSNSPSSEFLGSHIYSILGIPVHETFLGKRGHHIVVICRDFRKPDERLQEFKEIKTTSEAGVIVDDPHVTDGMGTNLNDILKIIENHRIFRDIREKMMERFWNMFIVDALISNYDRNNGNWGILKDSKGNRRIAPVYDNGNSFFDKWNDRKFERREGKDDTEKVSDFIEKPGIYTNDDGNRINPYRLILGMGYDECTKAVIRLYPRLRDRKDQISELIDSMPTYNDTQKKYIKESIDIISREVFQKTYVKAKSMGRFESYSMELLMGRGNGRNLHDR